MAILYKKVVRLGDPTKADSAKKAYPVITYRYLHAANLTEFSEEISSLSNLSKGGVSGVLKKFCSLLKKIPAQSWNGEFGETHSSLRL